MQVSDVRWPSLREAARIILRTADIEITTPAEFTVLSKKLIYSISEHIPARAIFPKIGSGQQFIGIANREFVRLGGEQPPLEVCWIPGDEEKLWTSLFDSCEDLLQAGYPGCIGCGGPGSEEKWDEKNRRLEMQKS